MPISHGLPGTQRRDDADERARHRHWDVTSVRFPSRNTSRPAVVNADTKRCVFEKLRPAIINAVTKRCVLKMRVGGRAACRSLTGSLGPNGEMMLTSVHDTGTGT